MNPREDFLLKAFELGIIKFGNFTLKSGIESPFYVDLRPLASSPQLLKTLSNNLLELVDNKDFELICGVPYAALPMATAMSLTSNIPLIIKRKENKGYGTKRMVEGVFHEGQTCLLVEDVITSGKSLLETIDQVEREGLIVEDLVVVLDREQGGVDKLRERGYHVQTLFTINEVIDILHKYHRLTDSEKVKIKEFLNNPTEEVVQKRLPLEEKKVTHPIGKRLVELALKKQSNLIASADLITSAEVLRFANEVADHIVALKLHSDIIQDFSDDLIYQLKKLAKEKEFLLFEDRKFADIGNTQEMQFKKSIYKISDWADLVTVHPIGGAESLKVFENTGVITLAEMSSKGALTDDYYFSKVINVSENEPKVLGCVAQRKIGDHLLLFTPGVNINVSGDSKGQQYNTPEVVFNNYHTDFMIVGRGLYKSADVKTAAKEYQTLGWIAYLQSLN
ncbi:MULTISPECIES: orotidine-5'-phosphate decarboxylase [Weeksella]|uniref:Orotate phosphoribosyltransferase n=1 Tax=Weeksella virosa (strain ATCC 43766 / DSM 16922 / JCM 21250 / CCUG 30538 / CDC 9751 / IAM 14551 / NBRC 16016 / NCTC 11634 / CL345/78) TaxID=865938 RepID=F0NXF8_WEEVC|nr:MULTISPECIES: orotidine-5'-phosphate decarboxylase [Weeksella]ADX67948.1 orotidine 5'-phosphate decarboxylase [Weeksella virosa DSM 16922]MDK7374254.1 orotidine-5'-phosphate decarboxylase [Weeksella virosa]MDK7674557.1 orotidine-5'-phosphate decarboxylase [Weeksella virosa]OFM86113.1 orotidine 5'-phosphate decarboxylase [Weeksella sp. HMSC059D05]SUP54256.1 Orotate phosphoribosyltransferase [Weeksella virosa]